MSRGRWVGVSAWLVVLTIVGLLWWKHEHAVEPAATRTTSPPGHTAVADTTSHGAVPSDAARVTVRVTDDQGPIPGANVRLASADGEILVVASGSDGVARADQLAPGAWRISAAAADHRPEALPIVQLRGGAEVSLAIKLVSGAGLLRGTVTDATGGPIAGARIDAAPLTATARRGPVASTFTAADGTYRISVAPGTVTVAAVSADYAAQRRHVEVGASGAVADFALVPGAVIEGVVRDQRSREPVAGARIVARRDRPMQLLGAPSARPAISGTDGRFRVGGLEPGVWELSATGHERFSKVSTIVGVGVAEQVTDVEILIGAGPLIRGRVLDDAGAPVADAGIRAQSGTTHVDVRADARGEFFIQGLRAGAYGISANGPAHVSTGSKPVRLLDEDLDIVVHVRRAAMIQGHVEPRQRCEIQEVLDPRDTMAMGLPGASTRSDGEFTVGPARDGPAQLIARCASGDQGAVAITIAVGMSAVVLAVAPGASIAGRVVDGAGNPVAGAGVVASDVTQIDVTTIQDGAITSGTQTVADANGAYKIGGLSPGRYRIAALERGKPLRTRSAAPRIELASGEHKAGVDLAVDRPSGVISGIVTDSDGTPLADAWVSVHEDILATYRQDGLGGARSPLTVQIAEANADRDTAVPPALTDAQGRYEIRGLPHAVYDVVAEAKRGHLRGRAENIKPDATVSLQLHGVTSLSGTVTGIEAAALFSVELDGPTRAQRSFTGRTFSFDRVDPGVYTVRVEAGGRFGVGKVEIAPGQSATTAIALVPLAKVVGVLVDSTGKPLVGVQVALVPDKGDGSLEFHFDVPPPISGPDGRFELEHRPERCTLVVMMPQDQFTKPGLVLEGGKILELGTVVVHR